MDKQVVIFDKMTMKKHSIRYDSSQKEPAVQSIYIMKSAIGDVQNVGYPTKIIATFEEVSNE